MGHVVYLLAFMSRLAAPSNWARPLLVLPVSRTVSSTVLLVKREALVLTLTPMKLTRALPLK